MLFLSREEKAKRLLEKGSRALEYYTYDDALAAGRKLRKLGHTAGFEFEARALWGLDRPEQAVAVLEEATRTAPEVYRLWSYLGEFRSDMGRYDAAEDAFRRSLEIATDEEQSRTSLLNLAVVERRRNNPAECLRILAELPKALQPSKEFVALARARALADLDRLEESSEVASAALESVDPGETNLRSHLHMQLAENMRKQGRTAEEILAAAQKAAQLNKQNESALWLIRDVRNERSQSNRHLSLLILGNWTSEDRAKVQLDTFSVVYEVVAETVEEALRYAAELEPDFVRDTLRVEEVFGDEPRPDLPKCVYKASGYVFVEKSK